jgi:hypothetical protein
MEKSLCCDAEIGVRTVKSDPNPEVSRGFYETFEVDICLECEQDIEGGK